MRRWLGSVLLLAACTGSPPTESAPADDSSTPSPDGDGDGYTTEAGDCDDADAGKHPDAAEDCVDGKDNDCDALVDCEDSPCDDTCMEADCSDGLDNDADSWTDCMDDDCWGLGLCTVTTRARVLGGRTSSKHARDSGVGGSRPSSDGCDEDYGSAFFRDTTSSGTAHTVTGTVAVQTTSGTQVCDWGVRTARMKRVHAQVRFKDFTYTDYSCAFVGRITTTASDSEITRADFELSPTCPLDSSGFLPQALLLGGGGQWVTQDGAKWYTGDVIDTATGSYHGGSSRWEMDPLRTGDTYNRSW